METNMPNNRKEYKIKNIGNVVTGKTPPSANPEQFGNEFAFVTPTDFKNYSKNIYFSERFISSKGYDAHKNKILPIDSIIVTCIGSDMGKVAINKVPCLTNQQINSIIPNTELTTPDFLYYNLLEQYENLKTLAAGGSTMPLLNKTDFENIELTLPPLPEQQAIAEILSSIDDKIELNLQTNKTLEEMANALYKHWFVDFGPFQNGKFIESELGLIPEGWSIGVLSDITNFYNGYGFKSGDLLDDNIGDCYHVFKMGHIKKGGGLKSDGTRSYVQKSKCNKLENFVLKKGDLLMSMTDMKDKVTILGHTAIMDEDDKYIVNQRVGLIRTKIEYRIGYPYLYILTNSIPFLSDLRSRANSGVQVNLSTEGIKSTKVLIAPKDINEDFNSIVVTFYEKIFENAKENENLKQTRDYLLPKLISGEIRVKDAAKKVKEVL